MNRAIAEIDSQSTLEDDEGLIRILVIVPDEVTLKLHELELVVVHLGDDLRLPMLVEQIELAGEIDRLIRHAALPLDGRAACRSGSSAAAGIQACWQPSCASAMAACRQIA